MKRSWPMSDDTERERFRRMAVPHLDAAYNLARWITRDESDAQDVVQEAYLRALRAFATLKESDARPWLLAIVRNAAYDFIRRSRRDGRVPFDGDALAVASADPSPEALAVEHADHARVAALVEALPPQFREVLILREHGDLSYEAIARVIGAPVGTVMSRLARARRMLAAAWSEETPRKGGRHGV
jgi:RNA polymerase sigma-70 factor (ECF subfamily)